MGESIKDLTQIGTHGIGFKAVYLWTERPSIFFLGTSGSVIEGYIHPIGIELPPGGHREFSLGRVHRVRPAVQAAGAGSGPGEASGRTR